jgi:hypothetical protein
LAPTFAFPSGESSLGEEESAWKLSAKGWERKARGRVFGEIKEQWFQSFCFISQERLRRQAFFEVFLKKKENRGKARLEALPSFPWGRRASIF